MQTRSKERSKIHHGYQGAGVVSGSGQVEASRVYLPQAENSNFDPTLSAQSKLASAPYRGHPSNANSISSNNHPPSAPALTSSFATSDFAYAQQQPLGRPAPPMPKSVAQEETLANAKNEAGQLQQTASSSPPPDEASTADQSNSLFSFPPSWAKSTQETTPVEAKNSSGVPKAPEDDKKDTSNYEDTRNFRKAMFQSKVSTAILIQNVPNNPKVVSDITNEFDPTSLTECIYKFLPEGNLIVKFREPEQATKAMNILNGQEFCGNKLKVDQIMQNNNNNSKRRSFRRTALDDITETPDSDGDENADSAQQSKGQAKAPGDSGSNSNGSKKADSSGPPSVAAPIPSTSTSFMGNTIGPPPGFAPTNPKAGTLTYKPDNIQNRSFNPSHSQQSFYQSHSNMHPTSASASFGFVARPQDSYRFTGARSPFEQAQQADFQHSVSHQQMPQIQVSNQISQPQFSQTLAMTQAQPYQSVPMDSPWQQTQKVQSPIPGQAQKLNPQLYHFRPSLPNNNPNPIQCQYDNNFYNTQQPQYFNQPIAHMKQAQVPQPNQEPTPPPMQVQYSSDSFHSEGIQFPNQEAQVEQTTDLSIQNLSKQFEELKVPSGHEVINPSQAPPPSEASGTHSRKNTESKTLSKIDSGVDNVALAQNLPFDIEEQIIKAGGMAFSASEAQLVAGKFRFNLHGDSTTNTHSGESRLTSAREKAIPEFATPSSQQRFEGTTQEESAKLKSKNSNICGDGVEQTSFDNDSSDYLSKGLNRSNSDSQHSFFNKNLFSTPNSHGRNSSSYTQYKPQTQSQSNLRLGFYNAPSHSRNLSQEQQNWATGQMPHSQFMQYQQAAQVPNQQHQQMMYRQQWGSAYPHPQQQWMGGTMHHHPQQHLSQQMQPGWIEYQDPHQVPGPASLNNSLDCMHVFPSQQHNQSSHSLIQSDNSLLQARYTMGALTQRVDRFSTSSEHHSVATDQSINQPQFQIDKEKIKTAMDLRTTIMIRNIPNKYKRDLLVKEINKNFQGKYNFIYVPIDYKNGANVGYAFINFNHPLYILDFYEEFQDRGWQRYKSSKMCDLKYGRIQGLEDLKGHFNNSSVMNQQNESLRPKIIECAPNRGNGRDLNKIVTKYNISTQLSAFLKQPQVTGGGRQRRGGGGGNNANTNQETRSEKLTNSYQKRPSFTGARDNQRPSQGSSRTVTCIGEELTKEEQSVTAEGSVGAQGEASDSLTVPEHPK